MTNDEMALHLLRAIAASMVCEKCNGTGRTYVNPEGPNIKWGTETPCSCRTAIKELLKKGIV